MSSFKPKKNPFDKLKKSIDEAAGSVKSKIDGIVDDSKGKAKTGKAVLSNAYEWNHTYANPLAMIDTIPAEHHPTMKWIQKVAKVMKTASDNKNAFQASRKTKDALEDKRKQFNRDVRDKTVKLSQVKEMLKDLLTYGNLDDEGLTRPETFEDYAKLFQKIGLPAIHQHYNQDTSFAAMRLIGPNPMLIKRLDKLMDNFRVTNRHYEAVMGGDTLEAALKEGRIFVADYKELEIQSPSDYEPTKYHYAPIAMFAVDKYAHTLRPVAIQCQQKPSADSPIYVASNTHDWLFAKTVVEMADANYHELVAHLGRTHMYTEPFVVATGRALPPDHAVRKLLWPHFEGTVFINWAAVNYLIYPGGNFDVLYQGSQPGALSLTAHGVTSNDFNRNFLPDTFTNRGVEDIPGYAYRDDSLLYWDAIKKWVGGYLDRTYPGNPAEDADLQNWYREITGKNAGRIPGFGEHGGGINTRAYLQNALTQIIFTASVQHAAVNFPQYDMMSYIPNMPAALYSRFPITADGKVIESSSQDLLDALPALERAQKQMALGYALGEMYYTELGQYRKDAFSKQIRTGILKDFQRNISNIGDIIDERNMSRMKYRTLRPEGIPQSINI